MYIPTAEAKTAPEAKARTRDITEAAALGLLGVWMLTCGFTADAAAVEAADLTASVATVAATENWRRNIIILDL